MEAVAEALIVVDMQCAFVNGSTAVPAADEVKIGVDKLVTRARASGSLVVHLQNDGPAGAVDEPATPGWHLAHTPRADEPVIRKRDDDGFVDTDLESVLRDHQVETVVLCGVQSEMCVAATARGAMQRGLTVVLPRDAHGTYPVPADDVEGIAVPAAYVRRVAEWSLGDEVLAPASVDDVSFTRSTR